MKLRVLAAPDGARAISTLEVALAQRQQDPLGLDPDSMDNWYNSCHLLAAIQLLRL